MKEMHITDQQISREEIEMSKVHLSECVTRGRIILSQGGFVKGRFKLSVRTQI